MDILKVIKKDHKEAKALLKKLERMVEKPTKETAQTVGQFVTAVKLHTKAEERSLYEMCERKNLKLRDFALEGYNEHELLEVMLDKLAKTMPGEDHEFKAALTVIGELLEHHAEEEEEEEMFPKFKKAFSQEELEQAGEFMREEKERIKKSWTADRRKSPGVSTSRPAVSA
jgi:hemerythrin superfamily protein